MFFIYKVVLHCQHFHDLIVLFVIIKEKKINQEYSA